MLHLFLLFHLHYIHNPHHLLHLALPYCEFITQVMQLSSFQVIQLFTHNKYTIDLLAHFVISNSNLSHYLFTQFHHAPHLFNHYSAPRHKLPFILVNAKHCGARGEPEPAPFFVCAYAFAFISTRDAVYVRV